MHATGAKAAVLTNIFGGSVNNEGLGLFTLSFDWQYVRLLLPCRTRPVADMTLAGLDHFLPNIAAAQTAGSSGRRLVHLLPRHARHILQQRVGCEIAALHVDASAHPGRRLLPDRGCLR